MTVHELYTALSQQDRGAEVTVKSGKLYVGGEYLGRVKVVKDDDKDDGK